MLRIVNQEIEDEKRQKQGLAPKQTTTGFRIRLSELDLKSETDNSLQTGSNKSKFGMNPEETDKNAIRR